VVFASGHCFVLMGMATSGDWSAYSPIYSKIATTLQEPSTT
jgi:hypothetical protein